jgi:hypothetical protein
MMQERFQHSGENVSRHFTHVLMIVSRMTVNIIDHVDWEFKNVLSKICEDK